MKRTVTALAAAACLATASLAISVPPASAQANTATCTELPDPPQAYGTWYKCTNTAESTTRYYGMLSASNKSLRISFGGWAPPITVCFETKFDTGYKSGSPALQFTSGSAGICR
ncbi:hypothetical protein ACF1BE_10660 [Streptomyces sp. NPDC014991]|uniref:hypothetical protein n=1 Tax=Streptomyces sp. NPDC014991 TaxID=3364935 RepID=UPI0036FD4035